MLTVRNARVATMTGPQAAAGNAPLGLIEDGAVACEGERIVYVGPSAGAPAGGDAQRLAGATYLEIAARGGGIRSTVEATRAATDEALLESARHRRRRML